MMTYSILKLDKETGTLGVAVASGSIAVATRVPWVKERVGAIATQAYTNTMYGSEGLKLLERGLGPSEALKNLLARDDEPEKRQVAIIDAMNRKAVHTGKLCPSWHGELIGDDYIIIGNLITGREVLLAAEKALLETEGNIVKRLLSALMAGEKVGGDRRGNRSAGIIVRGEINLYERIDDDSYPATKLYNKLIKNFE